MGNKKIWNNFNLVPNVLHKSILFKLSTLKCPWCGGPISKANLNFPSLIQVWQIFVLFYCLFEYCTKLRMFWRKIWCAWSTIVLNCHICNVFFNTFLYSDLIFIWERLITYRNGLQTNLQGNRTNKRNNWLHYLSV